jgi:hypothetical protein
MFVPLRAVLRIFEFGLREDCNKAKVKRQREGVGFWVLGAGELNTAST